MTRFVKDYPLEELGDVLVAWGEKRFRAEQIFRWSHQQLVTSFTEMTTIPIGLRNRLADEFTLEVLAEETRKVSSIDGTTKYLFRTIDGWGIESVWMSHDHGNTVCLSSQVGCRMGCRFCASTLGGCQRNLTAGEMVDQVEQVSRRHQAVGRVNNLVVMGSGEPLENLDNLLTALKIINSPEGLNIGYRHMTVSTCGVIPGIEELARQKLSITLSISLHAATDQKRNQLMPINLIYPINDLLVVCREYQKTTGRRVTYEYALISGVNDGIEDAQGLALLLKNMAGHVNLIPINPIHEKGWKRPDPFVINRFHDLLEQSGVRVTIRRSLGEDIDAACGQLRRSIKENTDT